MVPIGIPLSDLVDVPVGTIKIAQLHQCGQVDQPVDGNLVPSGSP